MAYSVPVLHTQIVVFEVDVQVWQDELLPNLLPDDTCHLIAVQFDNGVLDLDFLRKCGIRWR